MMHSLIRAAIILKKSRIGTNFWVFSCCFLLLLLSAQVTQGAAKSLSLSPNQPPNANFTFYPSQPWVGELVEFTDKSSDPDGTVTQREWDFGDDTLCPPECGIGDEQNPTHRYSEIKTYTVTLVVTDNEGATDTKSKKITIIAPTVTPSGRWNVTITVSPQDTDREASLINFGFSSKFTLQLSLDDFTIESIGTFKLTGLTKWLFTAKTNLSGVILTSTILFNPDFNKQKLTFGTSLIPGINISNSLIIEDLDSTIEPGMVTTISGRSKEGISVKSSLGIGAKTDGTVVAGLGFEEEVLTLKGLSIAQVKLTSTTKFDRTGFHQETLQAKYKWTVLDLFVLNISAKTTFDNIFTLNLSSVSLSSSLPLDGVTLDGTKTYAIQSYDTDDDGQEEEVLGFKSLELKLGYNWKGLSGTTTFTFQPEFADIDSDGADEKVTESKLQKKEFKFTIIVNGTVFTSETVYNPDFSKQTFTLKSSFNFLSWKGEAEFTPTKLEEATFTVGITF